MGCNSYQAVKPIKDSITLIATPDGPSAGSIAWSPQGNKLLVTAGDFGIGRVEVYILDIETGEKKILFKTNYGNVVASVWSPDGTHILMTAHDHTIQSGASGLWMMNLENGTLEYFSDSGMAAWSPDGKTIASLSGEDINTASPKIFINLIDIAQKKATKVYENQLVKFIYGLSWSPDGKYLVFSLEKVESNHDPGDLFVLDIATKQVTAITKNIRSSDPAWSPTGNIIAYVNWGSEGNRTTLHLISFDGKCDIEVPNLEYVLSPTWSPDGKKIAYIGGGGISILDTNLVFGRDIDKNLCP
jgi:Tol biopolymer transport system component